MADQPPGTDDLHRLPTDEDLGQLQWTTVLYYLHETNPDNGLVRDKTDPAAPCSIAACGLALATIPVIVERGVVIRKFAAKIALRRLRTYPFHCYFFCLSWSKRAVETWVRRRLPFFFWPSVFFGACFFVARLAF